MPLIYEETNEARTHLVIPDEHYFPGDDLRRCKALGKLIMDVKPDVIVRLGDAWDMASLCSYDKGKKEMVYKNVKADLEAGHIAEEVLFGPMLKYNKKQARNKKAKYRPILVKCMGNHENRVARLLEYEPKWEGSIDMSDFETRIDIKEEIVPYTDFAQVDGVHYAHSWSSGVMGRPFASARAMLGKRGVSCTMGHTHTMDSAVLTRPDGTLIRGLVAGCFKDPDKQGFAGVQVDMLYWNGVFLKHNVKDGSYDLEEISMERLLDIYGDE